MVITTDRFDGYPFNLPNVHVAANGSFVPDAHDDTATQEG